MVEAEWRRDELVVLFKNIIHALVNSKFNMEKFIFEGLIGLSERIVREVKDPVTNS